MTSTFDPLPLGGCDDPAAVLAYARDRKRAEDDDAREVMKAAARWASMHSGESLVGPAQAWHEAALPMGGEGCPEVAEFAVVEFAAAMGRSTESGRRYLSQVVEGHYRLRRCWARLVAGDLAAWRLGFIADRTQCLSPAAAAFVDAHVAAVAHKIGPAQLARLIEEAKARFDPEQTEADRLAAADRRHFDIALPRRGVAGTVHDRRRGRPGRRPGPGGRGRRRRPPTTGPRLDRVPGRTPLHRGRQPGPQPTRPRVRRPGGTPHRSSASSGGAARPPRPKARSWVPADSHACTKPVARSPPNRSASGAPTPTPP